MTFTANNELALHVADPEAAEAFYTRVLGCVVFDRSAAALATLQGAGCTLVPIGPHAPGGFYVQDPFGVVFDVVERGGE